MKPELVDVLTTEQLATRWAIHPGTLQNWRNHGQGPTFIKISERRVLYRINDILEYERKSVVRTKKG